MILRKIKILVLYIILLSSLFSCNAIFGMNPGAVELFVQGNFFMISWDYSGSQSFSTKEDASYFKVFYREHGTISWNMLSKYPYSDEPQFIITESILDYGVYDFAVSYVDKKGFETPKHSSLESSAKPVVGWYVNWSPSGN